MHVWSVDVIVHVVSGCDSACVVSGCDSACGQWM